MIERLKHFMPAAWQHRATILLAGILFSVLTGCASQPESQEPRIHGDAGVRVKSKDTSRIDPTHY